MNYLVKAVNSRSEIVALEFRASDALVARELAARQGLRVLSLRLTFSGLLSFTSRRSRFSSTLLSVEMLSLIDAGLNLVEAIQALTEKASQPESRRVLEQLLGSLREGLSFSQALSRLPQHFSPLYVATVKSSEQTGNLKEALSRYIAYQEEIDRVRRKIVSALIYPAILAGVGGLVLSFLVFYVVPRCALERGNRSRKGCRSPPRSPRRGSHRRWQRECSRWASAAGSSARCWSGSRGSTTRRLRASSTGSRGSSNPR